MDTQTLTPQTYVTYHLVKNEDLNHHKTMFAGRSSEWFVEAGFTAVAHLLEAKNIVCVKIHELEFDKPIQLGDITCFTSTIIHTGNSSITVYIKVTLPQKPNNTLIQGFITFINVDENQQPQLHGIIITPKTDEELILFHKVSNFQTKNGRKLKSNCRQIMEKQPLLTEQ